MRKMMFSTVYGLEQGVLARTKEMTRRIEKGLEQLPTKKADDEYFITHWEGDRFLVRKYAQGALLEQAYAIPNFRVGEVVAIGQSYRQIHEDMKIGRAGDYDHFKEAFIRDDDEWINTKAPESYGWRNKMYVKAELMPHRFEITSIALQHLQDISEEDCMKEGIFLDDTAPSCYHPFYTFQNSVIDETPVGYKTPRLAFASLIDKVSGRGTWDSNPWVMAYSLKLIV